MSSSKMTAALVALGTTAGAVLGATVTPLVNYWTNERQMDVKMVEIGIGVLRAPPKEDIAVIRSWAIDVIEKSSGRAFTKQQRDALLNQELPMLWEGVSGWEKAFSPGFGNRERKEGPR
jgi:hypothetical protein